MRAVLGLALALAGCNQILGITDRHFPDAGPDSPGGDADTSCVADHFGYTLSNIASCDVPVPAARLVLTTATTIDTTAGLLISNGSPGPLPSSALVGQPGGPQLRVVSLTGLIVRSGTIVSVTGQYGLAIVVSGDATIDGTITATANHTTAAAGSRDAGVCGVQAGAPGTGTGETSGGCGGAGHGARGAPGGDAQAGGGMGGRGGAGGAPDSDLTLRPLLGGCPGGVTAGDLPAAGGGAIQISASGQIAMMGTIATGGGGGVTQSVVAAASGGGSGGGVLLEAPTIALTLSAALTANGGAGADGNVKGVTPACAGENGPPTTAVPAAGGSCVADQSGGAGGAGTTAAHGGDSGTHGTGGGGAVGRIAIHAHDFTAGIGTLSPPPNIEPF